MSWVDNINGVKDIVKELEEICCFRKENKYGNIIKEYIGYAGIYKYAEEINKNIDKLKKGKLLGKPGYFYEEYYPCTFIEFGDEFGTVIIKEEKKEIHIKNL